jgi:hypothetical protein
MTGLGTLVVGFVTWLFRGVSLLSSFMTSLPLWRSFDLLPILDTKKKEKPVYQEKTEEEQGQGKDVEEVETLFYTEGSPPTDSHNERTFP